jgi:hypothetical protein
MEKSMLLAPMCERIASEWLNGNIERELDILAHYGMLDDMPEELMYDGAIAIEYASPAVHLQESGSIMGLFKSLEAAITLSQANPEILDVFDAETALRKIADYYGVSSDVVRTSDDMRKLKQRATMENAQAIMGASGGNPLAQAMSGLRMKNV